LKISKAITLLLIAGLMAYNSPSPASATANITTNVNAIFLYTPVEFILTNLEVANYSIESNGYELESWENPPYQISKILVLFFDEKHIINDKIEIELLQEGKSLEIIYLNVLSTKEIVHSTLWIMWIIPILALLLMIIIIAGSIIVIAIKVIL